jgi:hypothetical protein
MIPTLGNADRVSTGLGMQTIKSLVDKDETYKLLNRTEQDDDLLLRVETQKAEYELRQIINRTEKSLVKEQSQDLPNQVRIDSVHKTYNSLLFIWRRMMKQSARIEELELEIKRLKQR